METEVLGVKPSSIAVKIYKSKTIMKNKENCFDDQTGSPRPIWISLIFEKVPTGPFKIRR